MSAALYSLAGVQRFFRQAGTDVRAVDGVDLEIAAGEFVAVEGPSGSGKSTLLQLLGGLERPTAGSLRYDGTDLGTMGDAELTRFRGRDVGFVFQHFNLIPTLTARSNVEAPMVTSRSSSRERAERATELLGQVGLAARAEHLPSRMSGGEQQRVAIARALANRPRVILADEPTGNLDSTTSTEIIDLLARLGADRGVTVVVVTHADNVAARAARRIRMRDGRIVE